MKKFSLDDFLNRFPTNDSCLEEVKNLKYPRGVRCKKCRTFRRFHKVKNRTCYACSRCGWQIYPLVDTIFEKSRTPLRLWFYAMFLMAHTRAGISAAQLQRELGVTYKTAWRMFKQIRTLMAPDPKYKFSGVVEIDETFVGGKGYNRGRVWWQDWEEKPKYVVVGIVERGGRVKAKRIPNTGKYTLLKFIKKNFKPDSGHIMTDNHPGYWGLRNEGYIHDSVNHSKKFVDGRAHTQNIENFWSHFKRGITGVYRQVSPKYLDSYVNEYAFRYNNRQKPALIFDALLSRV